MKSARALLLSAIATSAFLTGCSSVEVFPLADKVQNQAQPNGKPIAVYRTRTQISAPYREYALLRSDAGSPESAVVELIKAAQEIGGEAIVLEPFDRTLQPRSTSTYIATDKKLREKFRWKGFIRQRRGPFWATVLQHSDAQPPEIQRSLSSVPEPKKP